MRSLSIWLVLALSAFVNAAPGKDCAHRLKESVPPPRGWTKQRPAPADHVIELRIGLPQPNFSVLEQHLYEVRYVKVLWPLDRLSLITWLGHQ